VEGRPTAGIATALVLGVLTIVWVLQRDPARSQEMRDANGLINAIWRCGGTAAPSRGSAACAAP
jgi:hypothetical protein